MALLLDPDERLCTRCMFCRTAFTRSTLFNRVPPGTRFAYDPATGRRWNLIPLHERFEAIEELERAVQDQGTCVAATANIGLYHTDQLALSRLIVGVPCTRCDPWSPRNVFDVDGDDALVLLRRALAYQHVTGADEHTVASATQIIRDAGSADALVNRLSSGRASLWRIGPLQTLALEIRDMLLSDKQLAAREFCTVTFLRRPLSARRPVT